MCFIMGKQCSSCFSSGLPNNRDNSYNLCAPYLMHIVSNVFSDLQDGCLLSNKAAEVLSIGVPSLPARCQGAALLGGAGSSSSAWHCCVCWGWQQLSISSFKYHATPIWFLWFQAVSHVSHTWLIHSHEIV